MMQKPTNFSLSQHWITVISLLYLALPCMLFFSSWFTPWAAWPVNLGILVCIISFARIKRDDLNNWNPNGKDWILVVFSAILSVFLFLANGIAGYIEAAPDILIFREALYNNLIQEAWPLVLPNGKEMSYYLAGMLPPALLARLTEDYTTQRLIAACWYGLGIWLSLLLFFCRHRRVSVIFLVFMIAFYDPAYICINAFAGSGEIWQLITRIFGIEAENTYIGAAPPIRMLLVHAQGCNFNPFTLLCASIILNNQERPEKLIPLCIALILPSSPLGAIGCMPLGLYAWWHKSQASHNSRLLNLLIPITTAILCALYFGRTNSATSLGITGALMNNWSNFLFNYYSAILLSTILFIIVLFPILKNEIPLRISLACIIIVPWIYYGSSPESGVFGYNELWLKSCLIFHMHLIAALCFNWRKLSYIKYLYPLAFILLVCRDEQIVNPVFTKESRVRDVWSGHLNHDHPSLFQKIPDCQPPIIPGIILRGGEAEQVWPGLILPKAQGCDYSLPAKPDGYHIRY